VLVIGCGPAGLVLAAQLSEAYWVNEVAFWRPDPEEPSMITRVQRVPDTEEGVSEFPHVIVNQARMLAYLRDHMKRSSSRSTPVYGLHASDIAVAAPGTTRTPTCSRGTCARSDGGRAGRPKSDPRATSRSAQRSLTAEIVDDGLTPSEVGMIEKSTSRS
jgi:hypothetical protein